MMRSLQAILWKQKIKFDEVENRVRYVFYMVAVIFLVDLFRCFPHIVNLACKATLGAITDLKYVEGEEQSENIIITDLKNVDDEEQLEYDPRTPGRDCIATVHSLVKAVIYPTPSLHLYLLIIKYYRFATAISRNVTFQNM